MIGNLQLILKPLYPTLPQFIQAEVKNFICVQPPSTPLTVDDRGNAAPVTTALASRQPAGGSAGARPL